MRATFSAIPTPLIFITLKYCLKRINFETLNYKSGFNYSCCLETNIRPNTIFLKTINTPPPQLGRQCSTREKFIIIYILLRLKIIKFLIMHFIALPMSCLGRNTLQSTLFSCTLQSVAGTKTMMHPT
jgi:hypothetical protein